MNYKLDWLIVYVTNTSEDEVPFAHTTGLGRYNHPEVYITLPVDPKISASFLNQVGLNIRNDKKMYVIDGDYEDILGEGYKARIKIYKNVRGEGKDAILLIIPDINGKFPGDEDCEEVYKEQLALAEKLFETILV